MRRTVFGEGFEFGRQVGHGKVPVKEKKGRIAKRLSLIDVYVNVNFQFEPFCLEKAYKSTCQAPPAQPTGQTNEDAPKATVAAMASGCK